MAVDEFAGSGTCLVSDIDKLCKKGFSAGSPDESRVLRLRCSRHESE